MYLYGHQTKDYPLPPYFYKGPMFVTVCSGHNQGKNRTLSAEILGAEGAKRDDFSSFYPRQMIWHMISFHLVVAFLPLIIEACEKGLTCMHDAQ